MLYGCTASAQCTSNRRQPTALHTRYPANGASSLAANGLKLEPHYFDLQSRSLNKLYTLHRPVESHSECREAIIAGTYFIPTETSSCRLSSARERGRCLEFASRMTDLYC